MKKIALISVYVSSIVLFFQLIVFSQTEKQEINWIRIKSKSGELSFSVPSNFLIDNEESIHRVVASQNSVTINVSIEPTNYAQDRLKGMRQNPIQTQSKFSSFTLGNTSGDVYTFEKDTVFSLSMYAASSKEFYTINVIAPNSMNQALNNFLHSIRFADRPLLKQTAQTIYKREDGISTNSLKTSPIVLEAIKRKDAKKTKLKYDFIKQKDFTFDENAEDAAKYSRSLIILRKPRPSYTDSGRQNNVTGTVRIKALFHADGNISDIVILNKLGSGLDENAADALRKVKFLPAEVDGKAVDAHRIVEYSFMIY